MPGRWRFDQCAAVVLTAGGVVLGVPDWTGSTAVVLDALCTVGVCALVWWRRRFPITVAVTAGLLLLIPCLNSAGAIVENGAINDLAAAGSFLIALALGSQLRWTRSLLGLLPLVAGIAIPAGRFNPFLLMVTLGPWLAGLVLASRQRAADQLYQRARELAEERELFAVASVRYERARIARELHDIVAHSVSLMVVQANAGAYLAGTDPDSAAEAFDAISDAADQARTEVDRLATLLDVTIADEPTGLDVVDALVRRARTAGLRITYQVSGALERLPAASTDVVHRVIQEAITNAVKHAPGAAITVTLHGGDDLIEVAVQNLAAGSAPAGATALGPTGGGHGLAGMRERVHRSGGDFRAGPDCTGGWDVSARLPRRAQVPVS